MNYKEILPKHDFAFGKIMEDKETCKRFIEQTLQIKIRDIVYLEKQKTMDPAIDVKGIRLDVYVEDDQNTVYNIEMQSANRGHLPRRSRYYQGTMDVESLAPGEPYEKLKKSFVIFVCSFDPFGKNYMKYTFDNRCQEVRNMPLGDDTTKIFLNTKGKIYNVSRELQDALRYLEESIIKEDSLQLAKMIEAQFSKAMSDQKWRSAVRAMEIRYQELLNEGREIGIEQGIEQGIKQGIEQGIEQGQIIMLKGLVNDNLLSVHDAAKRLNISDEEFMQILKKKE